MLDAGTYALTFAGQNLAGGDNTAFVDEVALAFTPGGGGGGSGLADEPFGYLGGLGYWQDPALANGAVSGLSYVRQRWLENATGQWLSVDPVATEPRYGYAHNMPTVRVDPSGMQATSSSTVSRATPTPPNSRNVQHHDSAQPFSLAAFSDLYWQISQAIQQVISAGEASFQDTSRSASMYLKKILPKPDYSIIDAFTYERGYLIGLWDTLKYLIPAVGLAGLAEDIYHFVVYLMTHAGADGNPYTKLVDFMSDELEPLFATLEGAEDLDPYTRGVLLGTLIGSAIVLLVSLIEIVVSVAALTPIAARNIAALGNSSRAFLGKLSGVRIEVTQPGFATVGGPQFGPKALPTFRITHEGRPIRLVDLMAKRSEGRLSNPDTIKAVAGELVRKVAARSSGLPRLTKNISALRRKITVVARLAKIDLQGITVEPAFLENLPPGINQARVREEMGVDHAIFTVRDGDYRAFMIVDEGFFDLTRPRQRVRIGHELAHGKQWAEVLNTELGKGGNKVTAYERRATAGRNPGYKAAIELHAQRLGMRAAFPDLPPGTEITEEMASTTGVENERRDLGIRYDRAKKFFDLIPADDRDLSFLQDLFD